jgi:hypothetical protein
MFWLNSQFGESGMELDMVKRMGRKAKVGARFTAARRARFLEVLEQTGNRAAACAAAGVEWWIAEAWRKKDAVFAAAWAAALAAAERKLAGARDPFEGVEDGRFEVIQRGRGGRLQIQAVRSGRWTKAVDDRFFASLSACGNVEASARLVGFSNEAIWYRWRKYPGFARGMEEALCEAEVRLEFRLACHGQSVGRWLDEEVGSEEASVPRHSRESGNPNAADDTGTGLDPRIRGDDGVGAEVPFDPDFALRFLKWREEKRRGAVNRGAAVAAPPPIAEVTERIIAKIEAIERHERRRQGGEASVQG